MSSTRTKTSERSGPGGLGRWVMAVVMAAALALSACSVVGSGDGSDPVVDGGFGTAAPDQPSVADDPDPDDPDPDPGPGDPAPGDPATGPCTDPDGAGGDGPPPEPLFYAVCADLEGPPRPVFRPDAPTASGLEAADRIQRRLLGLVAGTDRAERDTGLTTGFDGDERAQDLDVVVELSPDGTAAVAFLLDGEVWNPGSRAGTSAQLFSFLDPFLATVFEEPAVTGVDLDGLCWGEMGCDAGITTRSQWHTQLFSNAGALVPACDLVQVARHPNRCTAEGALAAPSVGTVIDVADDDTLNLRAGPGAEYPRVGQAPPGATVEVADVAHRAADGGTWRLIRHQGVAGWVNGAFLAVGRTEPGDDSEPPSAEAIVAALVAFAAEPDRAELLADVPLADRVQLGMGRDLRVEVAAADLVDPGRWVLDVEHYDGLVGPFSALDQLARIDRLGPYTVTLGAHDHCAGPPLPPPPGHDDSQQISVQPREDRITSCLEWSSIDLFLDADGEVAVILLDLWGP